MASVENVESERKEVRALAEWRLVFSHALDATQGF